jgi:hypothetical protein
VWDLSQENGIVASDVPTGLPMVDAFSNSACFDEQQSSMHLAGFNWGK